MSTALMMTHLGEWWIAERLVADPRYRQWAHGAEINQRMNDKPRLGYDLLLNAIVEQTGREKPCGN